jgi:hypothetical protein
MKIFLDTSGPERDPAGGGRGPDRRDHHEPKGFAAVEGRSGITTRPRRGPRAILEEICAAVPGPISAEVVATDAETMVREGKKLAKIADNIVVKAPLTEAGLVACRRFRAEGIMVNVTLCFSPRRRCWPRRRTPPTSRRSSAASTTSRRTGWS